MSFDKAIDRRGTYCTQWDFVEDRFGEADLLPFTISDTDFAVPEAVLATLQERLKHPVFGYTRWNHPQLKEAIQTWYQTRFQTKIEEHWIMYTPTVIYGISALIQLLTNEGEGIILQTPAYDAFFKVIQENKRQVVANELLYQEKRYSIDFIDLEKKLAQPENRCLLLCSPHNPTGRVWEQWELERMVSLCQQYDVFLLSDEIHMDIVNKGQVHRPITQFGYKKSAIITSGTKTFNFPGLIFAYALIPDNELRDAFQLKLKNADGLSSTSILGMLATMTAYQKCGTWVDELNDYLAENQRYVKDFLQTYLPKIKVTELEATYLMWLDVSAAVPDVARLQEALVSVGKVAIMDGSIYGGNGQRFLRLNIGCSQAKLHEGLERMRQGFEAVLQKDGTASIKTKQAPQAIGPYSQAKIVNGLLITSGQIPLDPETGKVVGTTIKEQTNQVLKNIQGILTEAGSDFAHVVKTTCYLQNMADFTAFNEVYAEYFSAEYPARTTIEISKLPMDVLVEIEIIAEVVA